MNFVNSKTAKLFIKFSFLIAAAQIAGAWEVDLSRRKLDFERVQDQNRMPASSTDVTDQILNLDQLISPAMPVQDIVIMNTDKGFIPDKVHVRKGQSYRFHLVNVNSEKRNVSFIMDEFAENHSTPFAANKTFELRPQKVGEFSFHCPETSYRGRLIVIDSSERKPASH